MINSLSRTKFQHTLKKFGYRYDSNTDKLVKLESGDGQGAAGAEQGEDGGEEPATKKRKFEDDEGDNNGAAGGAGITA